MKGKMAERLKEMQELKAGKEKLPTQEQWLHNENSGECHMWLM